MAANAGRSKLSTEEFNLGDEDRESSNLSDKYKKNSGSSSGSGYVATNGINDNRLNSYNTNKNSNNSGSNTVTSYPTNNSYNSSSNNSYNNGNNSYTSSKPNSYNNYNSTINSNNSKSGGYSKPPPMTYSDIGNNSFDRWNISSSSSNNNNNSILSSLGGGESVELLQEQVNHLRREYEGLKQRFSDLSRLRLSEPEEMFEEHKKLSELRDQAAEKTIKTLQKENEQLKKQLTVKNNEKFVETKESEESEEEIQESENDFMVQVEKILKIYSSFSGLKITPSPSNPLTQWHCEFSSRSGRFDFQLIYESDLNRYQYIPLENGNDYDADGTGTGAEGRINNLPQFLASDILITSDQMQIFFWRLLDTLSKKQQQKQQEQK